jgi:hypothetical protein
MSDVAAKNAYKMFNEFEQLCKTPAFKRPFDHVEKSTSMLELNILLERFGTTYDGPASPLVSTITNIVRVRQVDIFIAWLSNKLDTCEKKDQDFTAHFVCQALYKHFWSKTYAPLVVSKMQALLPRYAGVLPAARILNDALDSYLTAFGVGFDERSEHPSLYSLVDPLDI